jgi:oligosaccharide translocation protein RFT1
LSVAFLYLALAFSTILGPVGFIAANCCNFAFRICHNFYVIETRRTNLELDLPSPILSMIPTRKTIAAISASALICQLSEIYIYEAASLAAAVQHLALGGACFLVTCLTVLFEEPLLKKFVLNIVRKKKEA